MVKFIKLGRLRWAGHVMRLNDDDPATKKYLSPNPEEVDQEEDLS